ncbi:MAG: hypothetical protein HYY24_15820 [Verrucomicrobia bacterium]|nr:hypothetical protein [Verrucomicrobiota bacterium]
MPSPSSDPADLTVWPNQTSRANSDRWLVQNHDRIRRMNPRLLLLNFSNQATREHLDKLTTDLITALAEGSRYHGYKNSNAPPFLNYQVLKFVDLRDSDRKEGNSTKVPFKPKPKAGFNIDYQQFFAERFAEFYSVRDPKNPARFLRLDELVAQGYVHEVWFFAEHVKDFGAYEVVEEKPLYDETFQRVGDKFVQAGNGGDDEQKWTGRSVRIGFINASRGIGCFLESLSHGIEGLANSRAIPYFTRYFYEFAGHDLDTRYKLPWISFYPLWGEGKGIEYPDPHTAVVKDGARTLRLENYVAFGGNVHFPPNGRRHYDLDNSQPVMSTIEDWRIGSGPDGKDIAKPWTNEAFARYRALAPDCMGPWLVYWRQNFPGLDNKQNADAGQPMKNWWPFLFY